MTKLNEMSYGELIEHVGEAIEELRIKAYEEGYEQGRFVQRAEYVFESVKELVKGKTAQERRDEIVERAKADIEELKREGEACGKTFTYRENLGGYSRFSKGSGDAYNAEFIVNKSKRTVVVLLIGWGSGRVVKRGIAKCSPTDCFNVHIGKAIALRRALSLPVPVEYLNAPQPTDVKVGDFIEVTLDCGEKEVKPVIFINEGHRHNISLPGRLITYPSEYAKIIDDSREGVTEW